MEEVRDLIESYKTKMNEIEDVKNDEEVFNYSLIIDIILLLFNRL